MRIERDSMGEVEVPDDRLWGAQTQRSLEHFRIGETKMPAPVIRAICLVKRAAATVNARLGVLDATKAGAIVSAADEVIAGRHGDEFPLSVWQTGSGTQSNMNVNEVLANRASEILGAGRGALRSVHPNDDVNRSQSSNDVFPTAMHVAVAIAIADGVLPAAAALGAALGAKAAATAHVVKVGRTHLQDAVPMTLGQEISGWVSQIDLARRAVEGALAGLFELAIGGTAVGTGLNAPPGFGAAAAAEIAALTKKPFVAAPNKFAALAGHEPLVVAHGALRTLAVALTKVANDVRWLASGPRCGIGELILPANEPGSSIMPGKVNPTQCEALTMVCCRVLGNDATVAFAASQGHFELNVYKPLIAHAALESAGLLADAMRSFTSHCAQGIEADEKRIAALLERSLMLVTALTPRIGYDKAAEVAKKAHAEGTTVREAALGLGVASASDLDAWLDPNAMI
jgi:fumarate hydratase class II